MINLVCPYCKSELIFMSNMYKCKNGSFFKYKNGIEHMYDENNPKWLECKKEADGFVRYCKEKNEYNSHGYDFFAKYPYFENNDIGTETNKILFDYALKLIDDRRGSILEIGSSIGWACNKFVEYGFREVFAMDISDDDIKGLGYARGLQEHTGNEFTLICGDGAYLPFQDNSLEVVFTISAFHHLREKDKAIKEIYRVLKKDGIFIACGEPPRGINVTDKEMQDREDVYKWSEYDINEKQPTATEYWDWLSIFRNYSIVPYDTKKQKMVENKNIINHPRLGEIFEQFNNTVKENWNQDREQNLNDWLYLQDNTVMWGIK